MPHALPRPVQVSLYLLLLEQRYKQHVGAGLLCNLHSPVLQAVQHSHADIAHLLNRWGPLGERSRPPRLAAQAWLPSAAALQPHAQQCLGGL